MNSVKKFVSFKELKSEEFKNAKLSLRLKKTMPLKK
jgi:hypothetical protein